MRRGAGQRVLGRLSAEVSREDVAALIGFRVRVPVAALPPLDEGEYYVWQMIGAAVVVGDAVVGEVTDVHTGGPVEVFEIRLPHTREPAFVPSLAEFVEVVRPGRLQLREGAIQEG